LWKIEISCLDANPAGGAAQKYQFIYDGRGGRADTQYVDPYTVRIWDPTGTATQDAFARLPSVPVWSAADPGVPGSPGRRYVPSVFRVALVVVDPTKAATRTNDVHPASYVVARSSSLPLSFGFMRGDSNRNTVVTLADIVNMLNFWGQAAAQTIPQLDCGADVNDSEHLTLSDVVYLLNHVFRGGPPPAAPYVHPYGPYFSVDPTGTDAVVITNNVSFRCFHYCPCFNRETRFDTGGQGDTGLGEAAGTQVTRTETGCCVCRTGDRDNADTCDRHQYHP
jgi:hypothetical protein